MTKNKGRWDFFFNLKEQPICFADLPNKDLLDIRFFSMMGEDDFEESN